ncbi:MAG TPA: MFS transporter, partial [Acidimicrobiales bacterium]|nr:MFS transporter [Acidimicrobiales bacterium]
MNLFASPVARVRAYFADVVGTDFTFPLLVLFFLHFFDEFDTAAFAVLVPEIKKAFDLTDNEFAAVVIVNLSVVLLLAIPVGYYGDRLPRTKLVVLGAVLAGVFSFMTGLATTVGLLVLFRMGNGVGLLMNGPIHQSLLADYYPPERRPRVFGLHSNGQRFAAVVGPALAGVMAVLFSWRAAFLILIAPILYMAVKARQLPNPIRGATDNASAAELADAEPPVPFGRGVRMLFSVRTLRRQYAAWLFIGAGIVPLAFQIPLYYDREFHLSPLARGALGSAGALTAFLGVQLASRWTIAWLAKGIGEPLKRAGWILVAVGPLLLLFAIAPTLWLAVPLALLTTFIGGMFTPAFLTTQAFVSPARVRSLSYGFGSLFIVVGLWVLFLGTGVAAISDAHGIRSGIAALMPFWVIGGLVLRSGHKFVEGDTNRALSILNTAADVRSAREAATGSSILVVRDLDVSYGPVQVLFGVNFELKEGEIIALLGTNGAGKSTLLHAIAGVVEADRGAVV